MDIKVFISFWLFGLLNNVLYVIFLSAAVDIVGPFIPKSSVLIADILPALIMKLLAQLFIHKVPYWLRIIFLVFCSTFGMLIVASSVSPQGSESELLWLKFIGIFLASISSGLGELTFLQLTHYYPSYSISAFSSGTGGAGIVGSFLYMLLVTWMRISVSSVLKISSFFPFLFIFIYYSYLPARTNIYNLVPSPSSSASEETTVTVNENLNYNHVSEGENLHNLSRNGQIVNRKLNLFSSVIIHYMKKSYHSALSTINGVIPLIIPFMAPLCLVYIAEYSINQGIGPTLLFPLEDMPFHNYRDAYVTYNALYQLGVFISRSSSMLIRFKNLYLIAFLQISNFFLMVLQSMFVIFPNVYIIMLFFFYEGLLGGLSYVNTFMSVTDTVQLSKREFAMGAVGISDSFGILCSGILSLWLEPFLCDYQNNHGRPWCKLL